MMSACDTNAQSESLTINAIKNN